MNFLRGVAQSEAGSARVEIGRQVLTAPDGAVQTGEVLMGIRAENVQASLAAPSDGTGVLRAETIVVEPLGSHLLVTATVEGQVVKVVTRIDFPVRPGMPIWLVPEPDKLRWLRAEDGVALGV
jgi:multiple sugar transport system ATP-binding protein